MVKRKIKSQGNFIKFLGTAGARFVMLRQLRASGGIWISYEGVNILIDPGPGSLVRCLSSRPKLDPAKLDAIILTHRHLDHSADVNVILEAMTEGGFKKKGALFAPPDVFSPEPIVLSHIRNVASRIELLKPHSDYKIGSLKFSTAGQHIHSVSTFGLKFQFGKKTLSLISDTRYSKELIEHYRSNIVIINVVFYQARIDVDHLSLEDVKNIVKDIKPDTTILTHFGMSMLNAKPYYLEQQLKKELGVDIICASDGMKIDL